jgi:hypothetical protein
MPENTPKLEPVAWSCPKDLPLRLHRLRNPRCPPVLLLHGASAQRETFLVPRDRSLAEYLHRNRLEPWLLDWRGSRLVTDTLGEGGLLRGWREALDFDHSAREDVPWALEHIREVRAGEDGQRPLVHVVGHCMGASVLAQAIAAGHVQADRDVGRIVLLTIGLFYEPAADGRLKSQDHVLDRLWQAGETLSIDPHVHEDAWPRELREIYRHWAPSLRPHPRAEQPSPHELCDRVGFMYGAVYRERNLVPEIHGHREIRFARGAVEPVPGERLRGADDATFGFVSAVRRESGSWRRGDAAGTLDLSGAVGAFRDGDPLVVYRAGRVADRDPRAGDEEAKVAARCGGQASDRPAELGRQFGAIPLRMYLQGAKNVRRRWAAPFLSNGPDTAWIGPDAWERFRSLPEITLITGARNQLWHRDSIDRMFEWLGRGPRRPRSRIDKAVLSDYGHQDLLWGRAAYEQVFPLILEGLGKSESLRGPAKTPPPELDDRLGYEIGGRARGPLERP